MLNPFLEIFFLKYFSKRRKKSSWYFKFVSPFTGGSRSTIGVPGLNALSKRRYDYQINNVD